MNIGHLALDPLVWPCSCPKGARARNEIYPRLQGKISKFTLEVDILDSNVDLVDNHGWLCASITNFSRSAKGLVWIFWWICWRSEKVVDLVDWLVLLCVSLMRILFTGSRDWDDWLTINRVFKFCRDTWGVFEVVHGGARGVDQYIDTVAGFYNCPVDKMVPDYARYGRFVAPKRRNIQMLQSNPNMVVGFWDGQSTGTLHCLDFAVNVFRIPTIVYGPR